MGEFFDYQDAFRTITEEDLENGLIIRWAGRYSASNGRNLYRVHNKYYLIYVYEGEGFVRSSTGEKEKIVPGSIVLFKPGELQSIWTEGEGSVTYYGTCFFGHVIDSILNESMLAGRTCHSGIPLDRKMLSMFTGFIHLMLLDRSEYDESLLVSKFFAILAKANSLIKLAQDQRGGDKAAKASLEFIEQYIRLNYNKPITTKTLMDVSRYSVTWIEKYFKKKYGVSPMRYLTEIRLQKAKELLSTSEGEHMNISEICYAVGYNDPFYFSKIFKRETKFSPREYRSLYQNNL